MERVVVRPEVALQHRQRLRRERACLEQPLAGRVVGTAHLDGQRLCGGGDVAGMHTGVPLQALFGTQTARVPLSGPEGGPAQAGGFLEWWAAAQAAASQGALAMPFHLDLGSWRWLYYTYYGYTYYGYAHYGYTYYG